ncbi:vanadium-dependent haloperoxidase [Runella sp.]|uniref:vanadium-dependent haloperoxidase n=1 Tax=Runella sp. TaxID=1960881 RepID=UPI003D11367F
MKNSITRQLLLFLLFTLVACNRNQEITPQKSLNEYDAGILLNWGVLFLDLDQYAPGYRPPVAARALAYIALAGYEAVITGMQDYQSVAPNFAGLTIPKPEAGQTYHWPTVLNATYWVMMKKFFPHVADIHKAKIDALGNKTAQELKNQAEKDVFERSQSYGEKVADAVFEYSKTDKNGHEAYLNAQPVSYLPPVGPGKWQPTTPDFSRALLPYWGLTRTFVISPEDKVARAPLAYSSVVNSQFFAQALEVCSYPDSYENRWIGEFWSDDIFGQTFEPAARWLAIANQVIRSEKAGLEKAVYTYAKLAIALSDGAVACWNSKYLYNVERPVSFINRAINAKWRTLLDNTVLKVKSVTPPFPAYPSGHSTFGAVAAEVLSGIYGYDYAMTDKCHEVRLEFNGKPRSFNNFYEMAQENAISRILLGVHYRMDCDEGLRMGYNIGRKVNALKWTKKA